MTSTLQYLSTAHFETRKTLGQRRQAELLAQWVLPFVIPGSLRRMLAPAADCCLRAIRLIILNLRWCCLLELKAINMNLLDKFSRSALPPALPVSLPDFSALEQVRSLEDCIKIFEAESWIERDGLSEPALLTLLHCCDNMRRRGLGLEPNVIGRAAVRSIYSPRRTGKFCALFGQQDSDFGVLLAQADEKRDNGDLSRAEYLYFRALAFYPGHASALVQYSHMLKDQHKFEDALVHYLDAANYGATPADVVEHALFVAGVLGLKDKVEARLLDVDECLSLSALRLIYRLLFGHEASTNTLLELMLESRKFEQVVVSLINRSGFRDANRDLLRVVAETARRPRVV